MSTPGAITNCGVSRYACLLRRRALRLRPSQLGSGPGCRSARLIAHRPRRRHRRPERHDGERQQRRPGGDAGGQHEEQLVDVGGDDVFLEEDLGPVGDRLEHAAPAEAVGADAVLHVGGDLALGVDQVERAAEQRAHRHEHDDDRDEQMMRRPASRKHRPFDALRLAVDASLARSNSSRVPSGRHRLGQLRQCRHRRGQFRPHRAGVQQAAAAHQVDVHLAVGAALAGGVGRLAGSPGPGRRG